MSLPTIGSSDVAAILGRSPWASPWSVWARLHGLSGHEDTPATRRGRRLEIALGHWYAEEEGMVLSPFPWLQAMPGQYEGDEEDARRPGTLHRGPSIDQPPIIGPEPWMACRPDYIALDRMVEGKTARWLLARDGWGDEGTDRVPVHYACQVVWQMACTGIDRCDLAALGTASDDWRVYCLRRRPELERAIVDRCREWYRRHIEGDELPTIDGSEDCLRVLEHHYPPIVPGGPDREWVDADEGALKLAETRAKIAAKLEQGQRKLDAIDARLRQAIGEGRGLRTETGPIATWTDRKGARRIDAEALRRDIPAIAEQYTRRDKPGRTYTFRYEAP